MTHDHTADGPSCHGHAATPPTTGGNLLGPSGDDLTTCPVMIGSAVVKSVAEAQGLYRDYGGERYWFCCAGCGPAFDADPEKYATPAA